jgi:hypothetical protein
MSFFESVFVKLACERCGKVRDSVIRFRSYSGRADAEYELNEVADRSDGLSVGEVWEGNADRYCEKCDFAWSIAQAFATYDALAELIERGLVTARPKGSVTAPEQQGKRSEQGERSSTVLTPAAINEYAEKYVRDLIKQRMLVATIPFFEEFQLTVEDKSVEDLDVIDESFNGNPVWEEFLSLIHPLLTERMKQAGWVADETWENFNVSLDNERHIVVEDMQGRRLSRDGTRGDGAQ